MRSARLARTRQKPPLQCNMLNPKPSTVVQRRAAFNISSPPSTLHVPHGRPNLRNQGRRIHFSATPNTFVSSHFHIDKETIKNYLVRKHFAFNINPASTEATIKVCPFCHDTKNSSDNYYKLYIKLENGTFFCHRCQTKGSWFDFQKRLGDLGGIEMMPARALAPASSGFSPPSSEPTSTASIYPEAWKLPKSISNLDSYPKVLEFLHNSRGLTRETIEAYKVGAGTFRFRDNATQSWIDSECVTFPWIDTPSSREDQGAQSSKKDTTPAQVLVRMKYRPISRKDFRLEPAGGEWGLFGWHLVKPSDDEIILTEGEFDAMSVYQGTGRVALSLPNGAGSLPLEIVEKLERFKKIYLWMDNDVKGIEGAEKFATKLGFARCFIVQMQGPENVKDANDALKAGFNLAEPLRRAERKQHKQILTFKELRDQLFVEFSNPLQGHRKGELTIVTGGTGVGKTSILSQLSLDYCQQGVNTLWGSFELQNLALVKKMVAQFSGKNFNKITDEFNFWADKFAELPMYFLRFYGSTGIDEVLDAMDYACYVYDVEHVILDNLQFMTGSGFKGYEKFDVMDLAIEKLRKFATEKQCHVTIVIHPRKEDDGSLLNTSSVFGTAKATQEADNVIIVQNPAGRPYRFLQIVKNRFSGDVGTIPYRFDPDNLKYYELTRREAEALDKTKQPSNSPGGSYGDRKNFIKKQY